MPINNPQEISDMPTLDEYQHAACGTAIYPGQGTPLGLIYTALKMNGEAGEFAENVGKAMRDDYLLPVFNDVGRFGVCASVNAIPLTTERHLKLKRELGDVLWYVAAAARELGCDLSEIAHENIAKLRDRAERGKLQGSGDDR